MSPTIWTPCGGKSNLTSLSVEAWRLVEYQYRYSTRKLVDSAEEQQILEELIDQAKPPYPQGPEWDNLHFLLRTPFRYPPLRHGSRFGTPVEMGIWYGAVHIEAALAECAYYRLRFLLETKAEIESAVEFTGYSIPLRSKRAVDLTRGSFRKKKNQISDPTHYKNSQPLGHDMRQDGVEFFGYFSARTRHEQMNIGVFSPKAFAQKNPDESLFQTWHCWANKNRVEFSLKSFTTQKIHHFPRTQFEVEEKFPII